MGMTTGRFAMLLWAVVVAVMVGLRVLGEGQAGFLPYGTVVLAAAGAATLGTLARPKGDRGVAGPVAAGLSLTAIGDVVAYGAAIGVVDQYAWLAEWLWFFSYPLLALAMWRLLKPTLSPDAWLDAVLDTVTVVVLTLVVLNAVTAEPILTPNEAIPGSFVLLLFPLWDAIVLSLAVQAFLMRGARRWVRSPFGLGIALWLGADLMVFLWLRTPFTILLMDLGYMLGSTLMALAAIREPVVRPASPSPAARARSALVLSGAPMVFLPVLLGLGYWSGLQVDTWPLMLGMSVLFVIAFIRVRRLVKLLARSNAELREARDEALSAARAKSAFLATISHEIRTPMNGIVGLNKLLIDTPLESEQREYAQGVDRAGGVLLTLIDDILDMSQSETGLLKLDQVPMVPGQVAQEVVQVVALSAEQKDLKLELDRGPSAEQAVVGDPARLRQVLLNLVGNAVKFTDAGSVRVRVWTRDVPVIEQSSVSAGESGEPQVQVCCEVADTGIGISQEELSRIFDPFVQGDGSAGRRHGGSGLGLAISRQLIELMGGTIEVSSEAGGGSSFTVRVPLAVTDQQPLAEDAVVALASGVGGGRVLVVDDDQVSQLVSAAMLKRLGHTAVVVDSGEAALARVGEEWDAVLMDCHMPGMTGYETTVQWRAREDSSRRVPVIAMTASILDEDRRHCAEAGMSDFVAKPVALADLNAALTRCLSHEALVGNL